MGVSRPAHHDPRLLALIVLGGAAGTCTRAVLELALPAAPAGWPWATFAVNVTGSLVLGLVLEVLARTGSDAGWRRTVRLTAGTGFLGGYTTYSTFAVEISRRAAEGVSPLAGAYAGSSVVLGMAAAATGFVLADRGLRRAGRPPHPTSGGTT